MARMKHTARGSAHTARERKTSCTFFDGRTPPPTNEKRLNHELVELNHYGFRANVIEQNLQWQVEIVAPDESNWNCGGKSFILNLRFSDSYPFKVPKMHFETSPLTEEQNEGILSTFHWRMWTTRCTVASICFQIQDLLTGPPEDCIRKPPPIGMCLLVDEHGASVRINHVMHPSRKSARLSGIAP